MQALDICLQKFLNQFWTLSGQLDFAMVALPFLQCSHLVKGVKIQMDQSHDLSEIPGEFHIRSVVNMKGEPLGWAVCVLVDGAVDASERQTDVETHSAELLILRHCIRQDEAFAVKQGILEFLWENKKLIADLAFPREVWEWNAETPAQSDSVSWIVLKGKDLVAFRAKQYPLRCEPGAWHP